MNINTKTLEPSFVNRTDEVLYTPNGKGINVAFVLKHYGVESKILGFFGGFSGKYIVEEIEKKGDKYYFYYYIHFKIPFYFANNTFSDLYCFIICANTKLI